MKAKREFKGKVADNLEAEDREVTRSQGPRRAETCPPKEELQSA